MRTLALTLTLASCTSQNPLFGLDTETTGGTTSASTTTATASTTEPPPPTSDPTAPGTTTDTPTSEALTTDNPSAPVTSGSSDPGTSTGVNPDTTGVVESSTGAGESTGEPACELHKPDAFDGHMYKDDVKAELCGPPLTFYGGRLLKGDGPLRFATNTGCPGDANKGILSLGKGYDLPLAQDGPCAKLYIDRDGPGPVCDIGHFYIVINGQIPLAAGAFTPMGPPDNPPPTLVSPVEAVLSSPCCPADAQDCCGGNFGDYSFKFPPVKDPIPPGVRVDNVPGDGGSLMSILNIQAWDSAICDPNGDKVLVVRDWAAVRTNN